MSSIPPENASGEAEAEAGEARPRSTGAGHRPLRVPIDQVPRRSAVSGIPDAVLEHAATESVGGILGAGDETERDTGASADSLDAMDDDAEIVVEESPGSEELELSVDADGDAEAEVAIGSPSDALFDADPALDVLKPGAIDPVGRRSILPPPTDADEVSLAEPPAEADEAELEIASEDETVALDDEGLAVDDDAVAVDDEDLEAASSQAAAEAEELELEGAEIVDAPEVAKPPPLRDHTPPPAPPEITGVTAKVPPAPDTAPKPPPPDPGAARAEPKKAEPPKAAPKRKRPWFEDFFSDDYLRTVRAPREREVARECDFIEHTLALPPGSTILDVGCGLGLHAVELTMRGYLVVGLDLSLPMLSRAGDEAQDRGLRINFLHGDMRDMTFDGAFDGVLSWGTSFGYFDDEQNRRVIQRLHHALRPGGRMLLDTVNRDYVVRSQPNLVWFEGDGCICMEETGFNYITSRLEVSRNVILDDGKQRDKQYSIRLYSLHEIGQLLHQSDFRVIEVSGSHATPGVYFGADSPRMTILAERRAKEGSSIAPPAPPATGTSGAPGG